MNLELYWGSGSPFAWRILLMMELKKIDFKSRLISFSSGYLETDEFMALNPRSKVPVLVDGDLVLSESLAILKYLDLVQPEPPLFGATAPLQAMILSSIMETCGYIEPNVFAFSRPIFFATLAESKQAVLDARINLVDELASIEATLKTQGYLVGHSLSAADICLYPLLQYLFRAIAKCDDKATLGDLATLGHLATLGDLQNHPEHYPALKAWCEVIENIPGFTNTYPPHWRDS